MIVLSGRFFKHSHYLIHLFVDLVEKLLAIILIQTNSYDLSTMVNVEQQNTFQFGLLHLLYFRT